MSWLVRTNCEERICLNLLSPLAQGRELKYDLLEQLQPRLASPLAQGRELKYIPVRRYVQLPRSPLAQGRELKYLRGNNLVCQALVAPRAGAGIEIV